MSFTFFMSMNSCTFLHFCDGFDISCREGAGTTQVSPSRNIAIGIQTLESWDKFGKRMGGNFFSRENSQLRLWVLHHSSGLIYLAILTSCQQTMKYREKWIVRIWFECTTGLSKCIFSILTAYLYRYIWLCVKPFYIHIEIWE